MKDTTNFTVNQWNKGHAIEKVVNTLFNDLLIWNNEVVKEGSQYDGEKDKADFDIKDSKTKLDIQIHNFELWKDVFIYTRKMHDIDNLYFVASDGLRYLLIPATKIIELKLEPTSDFPNYRGGSDRVFKVNVKHFDKFSAYEMKQWLITNQTTLKSNA